ncbi:hypothetical protein AVEN_199005-1 [Araneus ventricosus]|uniref:Uncharacterized protein n=1 Tax=Araneus ventricosus TaxID=182803 RepID=A0A4Y2LC25_ARAVE|nr:hypothetical protein AVEN_199005-1 [Araneus ventricosus]
MTCTQTILIIKKTVFVLTKRKAIVRKLEERKDNYEAEGNLRTEDFCRRRIKNNFKLFRGSEFQHNQQSVQDENVDINDPGTCPEIMTDKFRMAIIQNGVK